METNKLLQSFAFNKDGMLVSIRDVERGKACECCCPACGEVLIARQGDVRAWHFAHESGSECEHATESALHHAAKEVIATYKRCLTPSISIFRVHTLPDGRHGQYNITRYGEEIELADIRLESKLGEIKPDVLGIHDGTPILIEIAVTHLVGDQKHEKLKNIGLPCMEVEIDPNIHVEWTWDSIADAVLRDPANRVWLFHPEIDELEKQAEQGAIKNALSKPLLPGENEVRRFRLFGTPIRLKTNNWGVLLWIPYNAPVYPMVRQVIDQLGGRWLGKYKNWSFPIGVLPLLVETLVQLGAEEQT